MKRNYRGIELTHVNVALTFDNGECRVMSFDTTGRGSVLPYGAEWLDMSAGLWTRQPIDANLFHEISRTFPGRDLDGNVTPQVIRYRVMAKDEDTLREAQTYRAARVDDGAKVTYDVDKLRECHREMLRVQRAPLFDELDAQWMRAMGQGKTDEAAAIEAERQVLRDAPADPRIDVATTVAELAVIEPTTQDTTAATVVAVAG